MNINPTNLSFTAKLSGQTYFKFNREARQSEEKETTFKEMVDSYDRQIATIQKQKESAIELDTFMRTNKEVQELIKNELNTFGFYLTCHPVSKYKDNILIDKEVKIAFDKFYMEVSFAVIGLILGSLKLVVKQAHTPKITFTHIICLLLTFSFSLYLVALESSLDVTTNMNSNSYLISSIFIYFSHFPSVSFSYILNNSATISLSVMSFAKP